MARRFEDYRIRDGVTPLSAETFNTRFGDVDLRLDTLEKLKMDWESAVADLASLGLTKVNEVLIPLILRAETLLSSAEIQLGNGDCSIVYNEDGTVAEMNYEVDEDNVYSDVFTYADGIVTKEEGKLNGAMVWEKIYSYDLNGRLTGWNQNRVQISFVRRNGRIEVIR